VNVQIKFVFVFIFWLILALIDYYLLCITLIEDNLYFLLGLNFILYFSSMAYGFFYFKAFPNHRINIKYYLKNNFETIKFYRFVGVELFRKIIINSVFKKLNQRVYLKGRISYLFTFIEETKRSETSHLIGLFIGIILNLIFLFNHKFVAFSFSIIFNLLLNFYPILLQRYHRLKLQKWIVS